MNHRFLWAAALAWVAALCAILLLFRFVGETAWPVVLLLYWPRAIWLAPGLALLPFALRRGRRALLVPLAAGTLLWMFPVMGFVVPFPRGGSGSPTLRILSYNTTHTVDGPEVLRAMVMEEKPDLVLFQWTSHLADEALSGPWFKGWTVRRSFQFTIASRYFIASLEPIGIPSGSGPPCAHAVVETPLGALDVYAIRPLSAREEIGAGRGWGIRQRLRIFLSELRTGKLEQLAAFREGQVRSIAEAVARAQHPVVIAGDTNLPDGSLFLERYFGKFGDAFEQAGWAFGYTHPAKLPWLRLDRVLLGPELEAVSFDVLGHHASAHRAIVAEIRSAAAGR
ncbi:MAG TPA: endonuclease/exonuclease/phosphatase family protein [Myxococcales bacterium]|nr:endonuclease/exonuclease/phosphatase family protein [Myxococcales bacterium]